MPTEPPRDDTSATTSNLHTPEVPIDQKPALHIHCPTASTLPTTSSTVAAPATFESDEKRHFKPHCIKTAPVAAEAESKLLSIVNNLTDTKKAKQFANTKQKRHHLLNASIDSNKNTNTSSSNIIINNNNNNNKENQSSKKIRSKSLCDMTDFDKETPANTANILSSHNKNLKERPHNNVQSSPFRVSFAEYHAELQKSRHTKPNLSKRKLTKTQSQSPERKRKRFNHE